MSAGFNFAAKREDGLHLSNSNKFDCVREDLMGDINKMITGFYERFPQTVNVPENEDDAKLDLSE